MTELFNPNVGATQPDWAAQTASIAQQKRMSEALRKQMPKTPEGEMISGHYVAPSWTQQLAPLLGQAQAGYVDYKYGEAEKDMATQAAAARDKWIGGIPKAVDAVNKTSIEGLGGREKQIETEVSPAKPLTEDQVIQHQIAGMEIPGNEKAAQVYGQGALARITREDNQAARREAQTLALQAAHDKQVADLEVKREKLENDYKIAGDNNEVKKTIAAALNATNVQIAGIRADAAKDAAAAKKDAAADKISHLPAAQTTAYIGNKNSIDSIDRAIEGVTKNPGAVGLKGFLPNAILARQGTEAEKLTRADISNIGSLKIHDRSGATVTAAESPRLMPFIPTINDPPEAVATKLRGLKREAERNNLTIEEFAEQNKYHRPGTTKVTADEPTVVGTGTRADGTRVEKLSDGTVRNAK